MPSLPHATNSVTNRSASHDRVGKVLVFLTAPFLAAGYYAAVTVLKLVGRGHA